jgi:hypothetical protein
MWRTAVGPAVIATISNGFTLVGLNPLHQGIVKGVIIILAQAIDSWTSRPPIFVFRLAVGSDPIPVGVDHLSNSRHVHSLDPLIKNHQKTMKYQSSFCHVFGL